MSERRIKVFAERNTGTNLFRQILCRNSSAILWPGTIGELGPRHEADLNSRFSAGTPYCDKARFREHLIDEVFEREFDISLGWKHSAPASGHISRHPQFADTLFVVIAKNPYAWLLSMYRRPYHHLLMDNTGSFRKFLQSRWLTVRRDNAPAIFENPIALWNYKYRAYMKFAEGAAVRFLRYEDILHRPETVLSACDIGPYPDKPLDVPQRSLKGGGQTFESYKDSYARGFWRKEIEKSDIAAITDMLDPGVMSYLGYAAEVT